MDPKRTPVIVAAGQVTERDEIKEACEILEDLFWLRRQTLRHGPTKGRASLQFHINPEVERRAPNE